MPETTTIETETAEQAYQRGRRVGLATGAIALAVIAYVNLLGVEKSLLAVVLAIAALRGGAMSSIARTRGRIALALASLHALTVVVVVVLFHQKLTELLRQLVRLSHSLS